MMITHQFETEEAPIPGLKNLPLLEAPRDLWPETRRRWRRRIWIRCALPIAALLLLGLSTLLIIRPQQPTSTQSGNELRQLRQASAFLEDVLDSPQLQNRPVSARQAATIFHMEDRIAGLDEALNEISRKRSTGMEVTLWAERIQTLDQLIQLRTNGKSRAQWAHNPKGETP